VIGYYDGFTIKPVDPVTDAFQNTLTDLITPSIDTAQALQQRFRDIPVSALGQPILETVNPENPNLAAQLRLNPNQPTVLFIGGYGPGYEQAFHLFCQAMTMQPAGNLLVSLHPKANGQLEQSLIQQYGLQSKVKIVPTKFSTDEILPLAQVILSQDSTAMMKAVLQGKHAVFVGSPVDPMAINPLTARGLVQRCGTVTDLTQALQQRLAAPVMPIHPALLQNWLGIPAQAAKNIKNYLLSRFVPANTTPAA